MTKMSKTQRYTLLSPNEAPANRGILTALRHSTIRVLVRNGWAIYPKGWPSSLCRTARTAYVTSRGLRAAGFDFDTLHAQALADRAVTCNRTDGEHCTHGYSVSDACEAPTPRAAG